MTFFKDSRRRYAPTAAAALALAFAAVPPASARLADAILNFDGSADYALPAKLSQTGLYSAIALKTRSVTEGIVPYEVNTALWSDGAHKERYITIPAGTVIAPTDTDRYVFPDKTVMIKNFALDTVAGDDKTLIYVETRFLVIRKNATGYDYRGISYAWNRDQSDANLVDQKAGLNSVFPMKIGGAASGMRWRYPSRADCLECHLGRGSLGFITPQLNRPSKANASINQLADLFAKGILSKNPLTTSPNAVKWAALDESGASLELRARSYLAANCSHCHGNGHKGVISLPHDFDFLNNHMIFQVDTANPDVDGPYMGQRTKSSDDPFRYPKLLNPGHADSSEVIKRMLTRGTFEAKAGYAQMPFLATYIPDSAAVRVLADWTCSVGKKPTGAACILPDIEQQPPPSVAIRAHHGAADRGAAELRAYLKDGFLRLEGPAWEPGAGEAPILTDIHGKSVPLRPAGRNGFSAPEAAPSGAYFLRWRGRSIAVLSGM